MSDKQNKDQSEIPAEHTGSKCGTPRSADLPELAADELQPNELEKISGGVGRPVPTTTGPDVGTTNAKTNT
jgi:hypothetical protein